MQKYNDFMLMHDNNVQLLFRFKFSQSHMHSFDENPPKTYGDVFKVYYSWEILRSINDSWTDEPNWQPFQAIFSFRCDECSALTSMSWIIRHVIRYKKKRQEVNSFGQPASDWELEYKKGWEGLDSGISQKDQLLFKVWNNSSDLGFRFWLDIQTALKFSDFLDECNQYMLEHGEPI